MREFVRKRELMISTEIQISVNETGLPGNSKPDPIFHEEWEPFTGTLTLKEGKLAWIVRMWINPSTSKVESPRLHMSDIPGIKGLTGWTSSLSKMRDSVYGGQFAHAAADPVNVGYNVHAFDPQSIVALHCFCFVYHDHEQGRSLKCLEPRHSSLVDTYMAAWSSGLKSDFDYAAKAWSSDPANRGQTLPWPPPGI